MGLNNINLNIFSFQIVLILLSSEVSSLLMELPKLLWTLYPEVTIPTTMIKSYICMDVF